MRFPSITNSKNVRRSGLALTGVAIAAVGGLTFSSSGAFFSDTHDGAISGSVGSIRVTASGGSGAQSMDFDFANLLPGEPQTATLHYQNSGSNTEDVWIKFPNATALSALNNLGTYGEVHVKANGKAIFDSANLNDRVATCGSLSPSGCWPLPSELKVASGVPAGQSGNVQFTFEYASKMATQPDAGTTATWNPYPVPAGQYTPSNTDGQTTVNAADGSGSGLPYELVATQTGVQP